MGVGRQEAKGRTRWRMRTGRGPRRRGRRRARRTEVKPSGEFGSSRISQWSSPTSRSVLEILSSMHFHHWVEADLWDSSRGLIVSMWWPEEPVFNQIMLWGTDFGAFSIQLFQKWETNLWKKSSLVAFWRSDSCSWGGSESSGRSGEGDLGGF